MRSLLYIAFFLAGLHSGQAQRPDTLATEVITFGLEYGIQWPGSEMSERFGQHFSLGTSVQLTSLSSPFFIGAFGYFNFGSKVKEDVLALFRTVDGGFINPGQEFVQVYLRQRGFQAGIEGGLNLRHAAKQGNWIFEPGLQLGWLSHHIRIQDESESLPYLAEPYRAGYDRLSGGPSLGPIVHLLYLQHEKRINIRLDVYANRAFTRLRRNLQYDAKLATGVRRDWIYGIRLAWLLPVYGGIAVEDIYY